MIVRCYETGFGHAVYESSVPSEWGTIEADTVSPWVLQFSDRCYQYQTDDSRAWPFTIGMYIPIHWTITVDENTRNMHAIAEIGDTWRVVRVRNSAAVDGCTIVQGNYQWYSSITGNELYHYVGPRTLTSSDTSFDIPMSGGSHTVDLGTVGPQTQSSSYQFASVHNNVNGLDTQIHLSFFNDLPPDYRPGCDLQGSWLSHDRSGGAASIFRNGSWQTMRTVGGENRPPVIRRNDKWINQARIGNV